MTTDANSGERGSYAGGLARREAILDATVEMLAEVGYHGLSLRDVARRVGISHPGVIYHFPSKEALLMAVVQRYDTHENFNLEALKASQPMEVLKKFIDLTRALRAEPLFIEMECMLAVEATSELHPAHDHFVNRFQTITDLLTEAFDDLQRADLLRTDLDPADIARSVVSLWYGMHIQYLYFPDEIDTESIMIKVITNIMDVFKPEAMRYAMMLGMDSPEAMRSIMESTDLKMSELWDMGMVKANKNTLETAGLGWVPPEIAQKLIDNGDWTSEHFTYYFDHGELHPGVVRAALTSRALDTADIAAIMTSKDLPAEVVEMVRQAMLGSLAPGKDGDKEAGQDATDGSQH